MRLKGQNHSYFRAQLPDPINMVTKPLVDSEQTARELVEAKATGTVNMMSLSTRFVEATCYPGKLTQPPVDPNGRDVG